MVGTPMKMVARGIASQALRASKGRKCVAAPAPTAVSSAMPSPCR